MSIPARLARTFSRRTVASLAVALVGIALYFQFAGDPEALDALRHIPPERVASLLVVGFIPIFVWGLGLRIVLAELGVELRAWLAVLLFAAAGFINGVTPFGQAGGDPISGLLAARVGRTSYEAGLAGIVSLNTLNRVASVFLGVLGATYLASEVTFGDALRRTAAEVGLLAAVLVVTLLVAWRYRRRLADVVGRVLAAVAVGAGRWIPRFEPPSSAAVVSRVHAFVEHVERVASNPATLALVFAVSLAGQLSVAATLWVALTALGATVSLATVLLVIPIAKLSGVAPTPGGFGSAEALLTALLVAATAVTTPVALAAAVLYRAAAFWVPSVTGALTTVFLLGVFNPNAAPTDPAADDSAETTWRSSTTETRVAFVLAVGVAGVLVLVVHVRRLLFEPTNPVVHLVRDGGLAVLGFGVLWLVFSAFAESSET